ncbi:tetraacyldisaccharide 4'-kinase [Salinisphaera sp. USBA-960]|uniref:tetraacyldisaccharide 4'-kinase n=1 Tax=Salinisphaera orenii TaxID=856731 RepID=UPI0013A668C3|nr:tetraacyldisaccharide 4'-kinase [Salifodinibacter halophilus]NNC25900.1 tetraacyldisaccharide 4'-kinase [Salifodinibacter halophilus]
MTVSSDVRTDRQSLRHWLVRHWYADTPFPLLAPLGWLYARAMTLRRHAYARGWLTRYAVGAPVIVVGNIDVGGNGKTPTVITLAQAIAERGWRVGVVARGYGATRCQAATYPMDVSPASDPAQAGDEPVLIARRTSAQVVVDPDRVRGARRLVETFGVDVVLADDGLQHLRLARDLEIALVDGEHGLGNRRCLPAGPLREAPARLSSVDFVVTRGQGQDFVMVAGQPQNIATSERATLAAFSERPVAALAGIAQPSRFFTMLEAADITFTAWQPGDHGQAPDVLVDDDDVPVLMTEKDAVKWPARAAARAWAIPVEAQFAPALQATLVSAIERVITRYHD